MAVSRIQVIFEQVKGFTIAEKIELVRTLLDEIILQDDYFTDNEIAEIQLALQEAAQGELMDFDEYRKIRNV